MNKETLSKEIQEYALKNYFPRVILFYNEDYKSVIQLKKELRLLTKKYSNFYKREYGFYGSNVEIFLYPEKTSVNTYNSKIIYIKTEEDAEIVKEVIIDFVNSFYDKKSYYFTDFHNGLIGEPDNCNYYITSKELNLYELQQEWEARKRSSCKIKDIFETEKEAQQAAYREISHQITIREREIRILKEKQKELEEKILKK